MTVARRSFLKALGMAPAVAPVAVEQAKMSMLGLRTGGLTSAGSTGTEIGRGGSSKPLEFRDFAAWLKECGEDEIRRSTRHIHGLDPDIIDMRLPLNTKVMMQRERQFQRELENRRNWFARVIQQDGIVKWWP